MERDIQNLSVKIGKITLTKDDYTVRVENGNTVGTGTVVLEAVQTKAVQTGVYAREKRIPVKITGTDLKKCCIVGLETVCAEMGKPMCIICAAITVRIKRVPATESAKPF